MDIEDIIAKKDAEILALKTEIADLKKKLEGKDLEEIVFDTEVSEDGEPMVLKLPEEYQEEETPNLFQDPNAFMQFMQLMMNNNLQMSQDEEDEVENEDTKDEEELEYTQDEHEEMPELEVIDDIIPE
jgi:radical SAM superfamily enzyme YgiQ (UPF0313 family)